MTLRVVFHAGLDGEPGVEAWAVDWLGLATYDVSRPAVLSRLPAKLEEHRAFLARHGLEETGSDGPVEIEESLHGDEILFRWDREPASASEISLTCRLLSATRCELLALLEGAPEPALDWEPPYRRFAPWADWRSVRATLAHVANAETHYYTRNVGHDCPFEPAHKDDDWREYLPRHRASALGFLESLSRGEDLARLHTTQRGERWSLRKCLRRIVRHEVLHTRSIRRVLTAWPGST